MRPSDLKSFRVFLEAVRAELVSLRLQLHEYYRGAKDSSKAQEDQQQAIASALVRLRKPDDQREQEQGTEERRHGETLKEQRRHGRWTAAAFVAAAIYAGLAYLQWRTMNKTYGEIEKQTRAAKDAAYTTCLNAQTAQATFLLFQKSVSDSHAAAVATVEQTQASIETERAIISVVPRFPTEENLWHGQLAIPFAIRNDGKSKALSAILMYKAVLLAENDSFEISDKNLEGMEGKYIPGGSEFPEKPNNPTQKPITLEAQVRDIKGQIILVSDQEAKDFLTGGPEIVVFYGHIKYSDFSGVHRVRFCQPLYIMQPNSFHRVTQSELVCQKYDREDDQYNSTPKIAAFPPIDLSKIKPISCVEPEQ
jgi:hypothetical protein